MHYKQILAYAREMRKNPTLAEALFWENVRNRKFFGFKFTRQYIIEYRNDNSKKSYYIADFYCHYKKLIVEIDGAIHAGQKDYDNLREEDLKFLGYQIIRFSNTNVVNNWSNVVEPKLLVFLD